MTNYRFSQGGAIVFGGSGVLGSGIVDLLSKNNANVAFTYLNNKESAEKNINMINDNGVNGFTEKVNLMNLSEVKNFSERALKEFGKIHSVINATGPLIHLTPIADAKLDDFYNTIDTDVIGFYHILKSAIPILKKCGGGSITTLTTTAVHKYTNTAGLSSIPKTVVHNLCKTIAREEGHNGIRVNSVAVGQISIVSKKQQEEIDSSGGVADEFLKLIPLGRSGKPEELFETVIFLASENAGYISGQSLPVDGGYSS